MVSFFNIYKVVSWDPARLSWRIMCIFHGTFHIRNIPYHHECSRPNKRNSVVVGRIAESNRFRKKILIDNHSLWGCKRSCIRPSWHHLTLIYEKRLALIVIVFTILGKFLTFLRLWFPGSFDSTFDVSDMNLNNFEKKYQKMCIFHDDRLMSMCIFSNICCFTLIYIDLALYLLYKSFTSGSVAGLSPFRHFVDFAWL